MLKDILSFDTLGGRYGALKEDLCGRAPVGITALTPAQKAHIAAYNGYFTLYITADRLAARDATKRINEFLEGSAVVLPEREEVLLNRLVQADNAVYERAAALASVLMRQAKVLVAPIDSLLQYYPKKKTFESLLITIKKGDSVDIERLTEKLILSNYTRADRISSKASFSVRGDIVEIFPSNSDLPYRISFFDDEVESIRLFEPESMLSTGEASEIIITPATDLIIPEEKMKDALIAAKLAAGERIKDRTKEILGDITNTLMLHPYSPSLIWLLPFIMDSVDDIFAYIPSDSLVIYDEIRNIAERAEALTKEHSGRLQRLVGEGECLPEHRRSVIAVKDIYIYSQRYRLLFYSLIKSQNPVISTLKEYDFKGKKVSSYYLDFKVLVRDLNVFINRGYKVAIAAGDRDKAHELVESLRLEDVGASQVEDFEPNFIGIAILPERIGNGIIFTENNLVIIGTEDVIRPGASRTSLRRKRAAFTVPEAGDYVVHEIHGIGKCEGIVTLKNNDAARDYVLVSYRGGDRLYVPVDHLDMIERYSGSDIVPELSKLGGKEFERIKENVKKSVKKLAIDLLDIYGKREKQTGIKYAHDTEWQTEFEEAFPYEETPDQLEAVKEIKSDMEKGRIMDRLICGDVGYGKTEVALRAVFKTVMNGRQAAMLAPTTILAEQHYHTAMERFGAFGVRAATLSRFLKPQQIKATLEALKKGEVDVVIATHRLLSKDVEFKDLGLLVLDEEQRFGVEHKEKIKALKTNINVLTLSATPIPRTLNMALTGVRDISVLETPPVGRLPVATYIAEYSDALVEDACSRELARGGQSIILFNNVSMIEQFTSRVRELLPEARIAYAHGQMDDSILEKVIDELYEHKTDILICSTIIENGIDLPDANTLIVYDADKLGLTELYQLRGRVGRRDRLASAYFTVKPGKPLTPDAQKRLEALAEYTEFGSGFKIAMKDLEIRGAGNILGREQHGHMQKVGYEMYVKLLEEAVRELKGEGPENKTDTEVAVLIDAYLTDNAAGGAENKMKIYKRIAEIRNMEDRESVMGEIRDIIGRLDPPVVNLVDISLIRALSSNVGVARVIINSRAATLTFIAQDKLKDQNLLYALSEFNREVMLSDGKQPAIAFKADKFTVREKMDKVINFLLRANGI